MATAADAKLRPFQPHDPPMQQLSPQQLQQKIADGCLLLDVRGEDELAIASLPGAIHIPLHQLQSRVTELNPLAATAVLCHHGMRSEQAARFLERSGFATVFNLAGGIDAWSLQIDPALPRY